MKKKGQLGTLQTIIITLIIIGLVLGVGFLLLEEFKSTTSEKVATVVNETLTTMSHSGKVVTKNVTTVDCFNSFSVATCINSTSATLISPENYTITATTGLIAYIGKSNTAGFNNSNWNCTYSYNYGTDACAGVVTTIEATKKVPTWLGIVVILLIVGILLAIVFGVLGRGAGGGFSFGRTGTTAEI